MRPGVKTSKLHFHFRSLAMALTGINVLLVCVSNLRALDNPPSVRIQPQDQSASLGADVSFRVTASDTVAYQWQRLQTNLWGATNATLLLTNVQIGDAGTYAAILSNAFGSATSRIASLTIDGSFTKSTTGEIVSDSADSTGAAWGDYDGDGNLDLFVSNFESPLNFLYRNNGDGSFSRITGGEIGNDGKNSEGCAWADFDNDGHLDLFVAVGLNGNDRLYRNSLDGALTNVTTGSIVTSGGSSRGCAWGDYDSSPFISRMLKSTRNKSKLLFSIWTRASLPPAAA
jgi:hypothetical protein